MQGIRPDEKHGTLSQGMKNNSSTSLLNDLAYDSSGVVFTKRCCSEEKNGCGRRKPLIAFYSRTRDRGEGRKTTYGNRCIASCVKLGRASNAIRRERARLKRTQPDMIVKLYEKFLYGRVV